MAEAPASIMEEQQDQTMPEPEEPQAEPDVAHQTEAETRVPVVEEPCIAKHVEPLYKEPEGRSLQEDTNEGQQPSAQEEPVGSIDDEHHVPEENSADDAANVNQQVVAQDVAPVHDDSAKEMDVSEVGLKDREQQEQEPKYDQQKEEEAALHKIAVVEEDTPLADQSEPPLSKPPLTIFPKAGAVVEKAPAIIHRIPQQR